jgi:hypothetical protein
MAAIKASDKPLYVYILSRPDGTPFYVGFGSGKRVISHLWPRPLRARSFKNSIIKKTLTARQSIGFEIVGFFATRPEAAAAECATISKIGRRDQGNGPLANLTSGGDGVRDLNIEALASMSAKLKRHLGEPGVREALAAKSNINWADPEYRERHQRAMAEWASTDGIREKISVGAKAAMTPERRARLAAIKRRQWNDPTYREQMLAAHRTEESRALRGANRRGVPTSDETKRKLRAANIGKVMGADTKGKISASLKAAYAAGKRTRKGTIMNPLEQAVRDAAAALHEAIVAARAGGYRVDYPSLAEGLSGIAVSETAKVAKSDDAKAKTSKK